MPTQNNIHSDRIKYLEAWAAMNITIWQDKMISLKVRDTGKLLDSLKTTILRNSGGDIDKITYSFLMYGRFVDMGVGRGMNAGVRRKDGMKFYEKRNRIGQLNEYNRSPKPWYNKPWYRSVKLLTEKRGALLGEEFQIMIFETLND